MPDQLDPSASEVEVHDQLVEVVDRPEGYRELRCQPATWSYSGPRPVPELLGEYYSQMIGQDPHGVEGGGIWSGSDAALALRELPPDDLAMRELVLLASRRSTGLNAPDPWLSYQEVEELADRWEPEAGGDIHMAKMPVPSEKQLWKRYGMEEEPDTRVITGYGMQGSLVPRHTAPAPEGAPGSWHPWSRVAAWTRWPRRQDAPPPVPPSSVDGPLLLFVSHRWDSLDHPDPDGAQLTALQTGLTLSLAAALTAQESLATRSGLPNVFLAHLRQHHPDLLEEPRLLDWAHAVKSAASSTTTESDLLAALADVPAAPVDALLERVRRGVLIWYDYASMFQAPRTAEEESAFRSEILLLNVIQASATTVVIAGDGQYAERAWCFLELCGGLRGQITELTPSWGASLDLGGESTRWSASSDQLIGALHVHGLAGIVHSGLSATHPEDLPVVARLLSELPLTGVVETDDSDLVGGVIPLPRVPGGWIQDRPVQRIEDLSTPLPSGPVRVPTPVAPSTELRHVARTSPGVDALAGEIGIWVYTTQRVLSLTWAARALEFWDDLKRRVDVIGLDPALRSLDVTTVPDVGCLWADARGLGEDGLGWTRVVPSTVKLLVIVTQADLPPMCRIYDTVVARHLRAGVPVLTYTPDTGGSTLHRLTPERPRRRWRRVDTRPALPQPVPLDVLAVPRTRRSDAYPRKLLVGSWLSPDALDLCAALRLDPTEGSPAPGKVADRVAAAGLGEAGAVITAEEMLAQRDRRVRCEARSRAKAATWEEFFQPRLEQPAWHEGMAGAQLEVIDGLVDVVVEAFDNPFQRRRLLRIMLEEHEGYALPPWIVGETARLAEGVLERMGRDGGADLGASGPGDSG